MWKRNLSLILKRLGMTWGEKGKKNGFDEWGR